MVSLSGRKAHILKTWQGSQGVWGRSDQDFGKTGLPVAGSSAREVELGWMGLSAMPGFEKKTRFDTFHVFPSCKPAPHSAQMRMYRLKMSSLEDCSCFREGCLKSPSSPFIPPPINVKLSPLETVQVTSVVLTKWGKMWFRLPKDCRISEGEGSAFPQLGRLQSLGRNHLSWP